MIGLWALRIVGAGGFAALGWKLGGFVSELSSEEEQFLPLGLALTLAGLPVGALIAPYLTFKPWCKSADFISSVPGSTLVAGTIGLLVGLVIASLISIPLYSLNGWLGWVVPITVSLFLGFFGMWLGVHRDRDMQAIFPALEHTNGTGRH